MEIVERMLMGALGGAVIGVVIVGIRWAIRRARR